METDPLFIVLVHWLSRFCGCDHLDRLGRVSRCAVIEKYALGAPHFTSVCAGRFDTVRGLLLVRIKGGKIANRLPNGDGWFEPWPASMRRPRPPERPTRQPTDEEDTPSTLRNPVFDCIQDAGGDEIPEIFHSRSYLIAEEPIRMASQRRDILENDVRGFETLHEA